MAWQLAAAGVATQVLGGVLGFGSSRSEAKRARRLAEAQMRIVRAERDENIRRMRIEMGQDLGMARAAIGAANIQFRGGSSERYMNAMQQRWESDINWENRRAELEAQSILQGGKATARGIKSQGTVSLLGSLGRGAVSAAGLMG